MPFFAGQILTAADLNDLLPEWQAYTPINTAITLGNGTLTARFATSGSTCFFVWSLTFGSTTAFTGTVSIGLPETTVSPEAFALGMRDSGTRSWVGVARCGAAAAVAVLEHSESGGGGQVTSTAPFTFGTADVLTVSGSYEFTP